jgi:hypothetical protein
MDRGTGGGRKDDRRRSQGLNLERRKLWWLLPHEFVRPPSFTVGEVSICLNLWTVDQKDRRAR